MATIFKIIMLIIRYGPTIWQIVAEIIALINGTSKFLPEPEAAEFKASKKVNLDQAVRFYKLTGDKCQLEELHGELSCQYSNLAKSSIS